MLVEPLPILSIQPIEAHRLKLQVSMLIILYMITTQYTVCIKIRIYMYYLMRLKKIFKGRGIVFFCCKTVIGYGQAEQMIFGAKSIINNIIKDCIGTILKTNLVCIFPICDS